MPFQPGNKLSPGRKKGAKNIRTRELIEILDAAGYCPVAKLIEAGAEAEKEYRRWSEIYDAIQDKRATVDMAPLTETAAPTFLKIMQDSAKNIMPYLYPKLKAVEISGKDGKDLFCSVADLVKQTVSNDK